jgi:hypothetical protein
MYKRVHFIHCLFQFSFTGLSIFSTHILSKNFFNYQVLAFLTFHLLRLLSSFFNHSIFWIFHYLNLHIIYCIMESFPNPHII